MVQGWFVRLCWFELGLGTVRDQNLYPIVSCQDPQGRAPRGYATSSKCAPDALVSGLVQLKFGLLVHAKPLTTVERRVPARHLAPDVRPTLGVLLLNHPVSSPVLSLGVLLTQLRENGFHLVRGAEVAQAICLPTVNNHHCRTVHLVE